MKKLIHKIDSVLVIRSIAAIIFISTGIVYREWVSLLFGLLSIAIAIYASFRKTGCGYHSSCSIQKSNSTKSQVH